MPSILKTRAETTVSDTTIKAIDFLLRDWDDDDWARWGVLLEWSFTYALGDLEDTAARAGTASGLSRDWFDAWLLRQPLVKALEDLGVASDGCERAVAAMRMVLSASEWMAGEGEPESLAQADDLATMLRRALSHRDVQAFLGMNRYEGVLWFQPRGFPGVAVVVTVHCRATGACGGHAPRQCAVSDLRVGEAAADCGGNGRLSGRTAARGN